MICSLTNKSNVALFADLTDGTEKLLQPDDVLIYDDCFAYPTVTTWCFVESGLLEDRDEGFGYFVTFNFVPFNNNETTHNWALEGF